MVTRPELVRPEERCDKVPRDHTGRHPICSRDPRWVGEGNPGLFLWHTRDCLPGDLRRVLLEDVREKDFSQRIL